MTARPQRAQLEVIAPAGTIEAILGARGVAIDGLTAGLVWHGEWRALGIFHAGGRLLPRGAIFDAELTARWGRLVGCTREFSAWWRARAGRPRASFFLEVLPA